MDACDRCTNVRKKLADCVDIYGGGGEIFRPPTYRIASPDDEQQACSKHVEDYY